MASPPAPLAAAARGREGTVPPTPPIQSALLIIAGLLLFATFVIVMLRRLLRRSASSEPEAGAAGTEQQVEAEAEAGPAVEIAAAVWEPEPEAGAEAEEEAESAGDALERLLASLPMFTLASALAALPKNSPDCAVCLSPFDPGDGLRLLPACRHAFHAACIDVWLRTNPVCPICRGAVTVPLPAALPAAGAGREAVVPRARRGRSRSRSRRFRVELGSVSHRRSFAAPVDDRRTYSLGGSVDYRVNEEVEAVVVRPATAAPSDEALAEAVRSRGWLGEYADYRAAASAPSLSGRLNQQDRRSHRASTRNEALAPDSRGMLLGESYLDRNAASASSLSGQWSQSHQQGLRRDVSSQWDAEAACSAPREEEPALVALGRWIFGM
ncbi:hypothetical protein BS78_08G131400 [Paspalum vaginatum]|nr:hypothetical protein BS78_08G131400 [Paspalum vaginatum]